MRMVWMFQNMTTHNGSETSSLFTPIGVIRPSAIIKKYRLYNNLYAETIALHILFLMLEDCHFGSVAKELGVII